MKFIDIEQMILFYVKVIHLSINSFVEWFWRVCHSSVDVLIHKNVHQEYKTSHSKALSLSPTAALHWAHAYMPSTVLLQKQFYTDTNTDTHM